MVLRLGANEVVTVDLAGRREVVHRISTFPFSLDWLPDGHLLIASSELQRRETDRSLVTHSDLSHLAGGWNEIVVDGRGNAYINQAGFDLMGGAEPASGTIALAAPDGSSREVADAVWFPNGMVVTPDNSTLIVGASYRNRLTAFDIDQEGDLSNRRVWADLGADVPDGICMDSEEAIGTPMFRAAAVCVCGRVAKSSRQSPLIAAASPVRSEARRPNLVHRCHRVARSRRYVPRRSHWPGPYRRRRDTARRISLRQISRTNHGRRPPGRRTAEHVVDKVSERV